MHDAARYTHIAARRLQFEALLALGSLLFGVGWGLAGSAPVRRWLPSAPATSRRSCSSSRCWPACSFEWAEHGRARTTADAKPRSAAIK